MVSEKECQEARALQDELNEKFFRFEWTISKTDDVIHIVAYFEAVDGKLRVSMHVPQALCQGPGGAAFIAQEISACVGWELIHASRQERQ